MRNFLIIKDNRVIRRMRCTRLPPQEDWAGGDECIEIGFDPRLAEYDKVNGTVSRLPEPTDREVRDLDEERDQALLERLERIAGRPRLAGRLKAILALLAD